MFTGQTTKNIKEYIEENDCAIVYVSNNMTHYFQPLDLTVNAVAKHFLKDKFELWYANEVKKKLDEGTKVYNIFSTLTFNVLKSSFKSSHPEGFLRKGVLKICSKLTGEHPYRSVISIKLLCNYKIALRHGCCPAHLLHIFRTPFSRNISGWLLLFFPN